MGRSITKTTYFQSTMQLLYILRLLTMPENGFCCPLFFRYRKEAEWDGTGRMTPSHQIMAWWRWQTRWKSSSAPQGSFPSPSGHLFSPLRAPLLPLQESHPPFRDNSASYSFLAWWLAKIVGFFLPFRVFSPPCHILPSLVPFRELHAVPPQGPRNSTRQH